MPDLGHEPTFGLFLPNPASQAATVVRLAQLAEQSGLDLIGVQDHPYNPDLLDTWTLLSHLAAATSTIRLFPDVACVPLRPPVVLARSVASLDLLTGGRVELGLGAGYFLEPIGRMGGPVLTPGEAVDALAEAIGVIRAIWTAGGPVTRPGRYHPVDGVAPGPAPAHPVGIWVGAYRPRMLSLTARLGDGWVPSQAYASPERTARLTARLDELTVQAGRAPGDIRRIYNINGRFGATAGGFLDGPPALWAAQLTDLVLDQGFSSFLLAPAGDIVSSIERFGQEVAPDVRERVAAARRGARPEPEPAGPAPITIARPADDAGTERDGHWGAAGGLPVQDRPQPPRLDPPAAAPSFPDNVRNLIAIHDHLRSELEQIDQAVRQVAEGALTPADARSLISRMTVRQNHWTLGSFCASYCRIVTIHHAVEDAHMFPGVRAAAPQIGAVVDRLEAEHHVIAEVLDRFDRALVDLVREDDPAGTGDRGIVEIGSLAEHLGQILRSHLAYEEDSLGQALTLMPSPI